MRDVFPAVRVSVLSKDSVFFHRIGYQSSHCFEHTSGVCLIHLIVIIGIAKENWSDPDVFGFCTAVLTPFY
ncbi:hypothetical protein [Methanogenium organophilum]|uniref:Uncharacterized protein n=1 Tax=Methanogenium organophilum TaxID=2199 RepID=A0A9X9S2G9_METOG|nr:hypothetical protein [Methanogenium organophilum]WAI00603.1 hypothetical protein OU421_09205 [Methanogenium organophilum]